MGAYRQRIGRRGEEIAAAYLEEQGFEIVERNWRWRHGEIDLVARDGEEWVLVEVRLLRDPEGDWTPEATLTRRKWRQMLRNARVFLHQRWGDREPPPWRIDFVGIVLDRRGEVTSLVHLRGIWR